LTGNNKCEPFFNKSRDALSAANTFLAQQEEAINEGLKERSRDLQSAIDGLAAVHAGFGEKIAERLAELRHQGLSGSVDELNQLIAQRNRISREVINITNQQPQLLQLRKRRDELLKELEITRDGILARRKAQLRIINANLRRTIKDYVINLLYAPAGIIGEFKDLLLEVMQGTYFQEETADVFCATITPSELAALVRNRDVDGIAAKGLDREWAEEILSRFQILTRLHALEVIWKPPSPVIKVQTRAMPPKQIPINQLSDGQKHTILLTIAMLAESNVPLIIDQPEDDLDNEFISTAVVSTLRAIKERRQVIVVTHNANIAVLGDSELILPLRRDGESGQVLNSGSIDTPETKQSVQQILEGGDLAFRRRMAIYGY
jgi:hypothetical protein